jgi:RNA 3'-terminal phosphate cyclase (ATP)
LLAHRASGAALDAHLADQLVVPLALARGVSRASVERATLHLETNAWLARELDVADARIVAGGVLPELHVVPRG